MLFQGMYYMITGLWPLLHVGSFEAVTGQKMDKFTLRSTGLMIVIVGAILALASREKRPDPGFTALGVGSAVGLATLEVVNAQRIRQVYLLEALGEFGLAGMLIVTRLLARLKFI